MTDAEVLGFWRRRSTGWHGSSASHICFPSELFGESESAVPALRLVRPFGRVRASPRDRERERTHAGGALALRRDALVYLCAVSVALVQVSGVRNAALKKERAGWVIARSGVLGERREFGLCWGERANENESKSGFGGPVGVIDVGSGRPAVFSVLPRQPMAMGIDGWRVACLVTINFMKFS